MLVIKCCDAAPNPCDCSNPWFELYARMAPEARCLGWKRRPAPKWPAWLSLQLERSRRKRWAVLEQPHPRWRHADGQRAELAWGDAQAAAWRERWKLKTPE